VPPFGLTKIAVPFDVPLGVAAPGLEPVNAERKADFGGQQHGPNPTAASQRVEALSTPRNPLGGPDVGAASDGDGDRNMVVGGVAQEVGQVAP